MPRPWWQCYLKQLFVAAINSAFPFPLLTLTSLTPTSLCTSTTHGLISAVMPPRAGPTNEPWFTYLWCIAVNNQLKVLIKPFQLLLPLDSKCDLFFIHLRVAALRLRNLDYLIFFLYKPRSDIPTDLSVENLDTTQVDLSPSTCLNPNAIIWCHFPTVEGNDLPGGLVHAVICIDDTTGTNTSQFYQSRSMFTVMLSQ